jgi:putative flippase GtrA
MRIDLAAVWQRYFSWLISPAMFKWWVVGLSFAGVNVGLLYVFVDLLKQPVLLSTVVAAAIGTIFRFLINDWWVFRRRAPSWRRLGQYIVANAGSMAIWWIATNAIVVLGGHYVLASLAGMACSVFVSMLTNFLWVWRHRGGPGQVEAVAGTTPKIEP